MLVVPAYVAQCQSVGATGFRLILIGLEIDRCSLEDAQINHVTKRFANIVGQLLAIPGNLNRFILIPWIKHMRNVAEMEVVEPKPLHVEGSAIIFKDLRFLASPNQPLHRSIALEAATAVHREDQDNVWGKTQSRVELLLIVSLSGPNVVLNGQN